MYNVYDVYLMDYGQNIQSIYALSVVFTRPKELPQYNYRNNGHELYHT